MRMSAFSRIEEIDRHFKSEPPSEGLLWLDAFDPRLSLRGHGWREEAVAARSFRRIPERAAAGLSEAVQKLSWAPASLFLSFFSDATELSVRICNENTASMSHMPLTGSAGVELYMRDGVQWVPLATAVPGLDNRLFERRLVRGWTPIIREYRLYLPLYKGVEEICLGFSPQARILANPRSKENKPILFYGTSITQGGCANTPGSDFVSIVGRLLDSDTINLGFSGNGKGEPEVARLIAEVDAQMFVLNYDANCELERLKKSLPEFFRILRERHPRTPVVLLGTVPLSSALWDAGLRELLAARRDTLMRFYLHAKDAGDEGIYFIDGEGILPPGLTGAFVDGSHPTSGGFSIMAERLAPHLARIRNWQQTGC